MARLLIHVEGQTEEIFVNRILGPHLYARGYTMVSARLIGNARQRERRGGIRGWKALRVGIIQHLQRDLGCLATTMVDYYGLPQTGERAWPGRAAAAGLAFAKKAMTVQNAMLADVNKRLRGGAASRRFLPFVVMHEFEGLMFSDCTRFAEGIGRPELVAQLQSIRDDFKSPEEIDDSPVSAPSKRVEQLLPGYEKPLFGALAVLQIGLEAIRDECPHFRNWLERLETWPK
jgi:hypothetical protein